MAVAKCLEVVEVEPSRIVLVVARCFGKAVG